MVREPTRVVVKKRRGTWGTSVRSQKTGEELLISSLGSVILNTEKVTQAPSPTYVLSLSCSSSQDSDNPAPQESLKSVGLEDFYVLSVHFCLD